MTRRLLATAFVLAVALTSLSAAAWAAGEDPRLRPAAAGDRYEVRWIEKRFERQYDGELAEGATRTYSLDVAQPNVTRVDFVLSWIETNDPLEASEEDTFRFDARKPDGSSVDGSPARGAGNVLVLRSGVVNRAPDATTVDGDGLAALLGESARAASGAWLVTVALESAGNPAGSRVDSGNTFVLTAVVRFYEASVLKAVSLEPPQKLAGSGSGLWEYATYGLGAASVVLGGLLLGGRKKR